MSATFIIDEKTGNAYTRIPLSSKEANTFRANHIRLDKPAAVAEADFIVQAYIRAYHAVVPMRTIEEEEAEEREWESIVSKPHVQQALRRMAAEVRRQIVSGEIEEATLQLSEKQTNKTISQTVLAVATGYTRSSKSFLPPFQSGSLLS